MAMESAIETGWNIPNARIAEARHELRLPAELSTNELKEAAKEELMEAVKADQMLPLYKSICAEFGWEENADLCASLEKQNEASMKEIDEALLDAKENYGDVEIRDALLRRAQFLVKIGDKAAGVTAFEIALDKTVGAGRKLDVLLTLVRLGLSFGDVPLTTQSIQRCRDELAKGGDWERRNKLNVYEGLLRLQNRNFKEAANLFLNSLATFTATEVLPFSQFVFYTVVASIITVDRSEYRTKILNSPEVLQVVSEDEVLRKFSVSLYHCEFNQLMVSLVELSTRMRRDRFIGPHWLYYARQLRLRAYAQFLEPFKSVTISAMAQAFGVSESFIEEGVSTFIADGKLRCKIDRLSGVIESDVQDRRSALYGDIIKQGDGLLNRLQKLSRVIDA